MTETNSITNAIISFLNLNRHFVWRNNNGGIFDPTRKTFRSFHSIKGAPDITGLTPDGYFIGIEVKGTKGDKQRAEQKEFQINIERRKGIYLLVRSFDDFYKQYGGKLNSIH